MNNRKKRFANTDFYRGAMRWMGVGIEFCLVIGIFCLVGYFLDKKEGTTPGWMVIFFFIGFGIMIYTMLRRAKKDEDERRQAEEERDQDDV
jgi:F0F1-type ATP synthase assembly protein I